MTKIIEANSEALCEMAGRMYEATDIVIAIENGEIKSLDEALLLLKQSANALSRLLKCKQWVVGDNFCVDIPASIAINQESFISKDEADESDRENIAKVLGISASEISDAALENLRCGPHDEAVRERWISKPWLQ